MRRSLFLGLLTSLRTTIALLCLLALLLLLNVVIPQASLIGQEAYNRLLLGGRWNRFLLVTLELGHLPTSRIFLVALTLFFAHLGCVLASRAGPAWRRTRAQPGKEAGVMAWARLDESLSGPLPEDWNAGTIARTLRGYGYRVRRIGAQAFWGVKHRTAPLGFLLFHLSFFLLCAGGALIYYTRFVATAVLTEGQEFGGEYKEILRRPSLGQEPPLRFTVEEIDPRFERGERVHLGASFRFHGAGLVGLRRASVNHPARWGAASILVQQAGPAPVLWLQDQHGFTLDRVAVAGPALGGESTEVPLAGGRYTAVLEPPLSADHFPTRKELSQTPVRLSVFRAGGEGEAASVPLYVGTLRPGQAAALGDGRLVLEELRFWVGLTIVSERGGGLLISGFVAGIAGLIWRLVLFRRELAVVWDDESFFLVGRTETFSLRFREEQKAIFTTLRAPPPLAGAKDAEQLRAARG